jgi:Dyp-type peroxidase family
VAVEDPAAGRAWLAELVDRVTPALEWDGESTPSATLNLAITHPGLAALGVPRRLLDSFPDDFREGMAARACAIGDVGVNDPQRWEQELASGPRHVLVSTYCVTGALLEQGAAELRRRIAQAGSGVRIVHEVDGGLVDHGRHRLSREHFGFADGFSQPDVRGMHSGSREGEGTRHRFGWRSVAPGEFVLGYPDEDGQLPPAPAAPLGRNGSFLVVRKLHQHVARFHRFLREAASGEWGEEELAARVVGRWRDGSPLALSPLRPDPAVARSKSINRFGYADDPDGLRCPVGAHVRRSNPRDALGWQGRLTRRHRIIRRGMSYGEAPVDLAIEDKVERGLLFACYQASISRQFELIQRRWLGDGNAFGLGGDADFLLGPADPDGKMAIPGHPPKLLSPIPEFITLRGGDYFFAPGLTALRALAGGFG